MVAAAKLRRAQSAAEAARPYSERMAVVLGNIANGVYRRPRDPRSSLAPARPRSPSDRLHRRTRSLRRVQLLDRASCP